MRSMHSVAILAFVVLAALVALAYASYARDIRMARERVAVGSRIAQTACGPIEYAIGGEGSPVLVVHGAGGGFDQGLDIGAPLAAKGLQIIAVSRFGYLRTPLPHDASAAAQSDAHACLLDALGIPRAAVVGVSAGAPSALQFALRHPDRTAALVLVVPAAYVPRPADAAPVKAPSSTQLLFDTALRSDFLFWAAIRLAPGIVMRSILATPPAVVESASVGEKARVEEIMAHILPVSPRRLGLRNDAAVVSSIPRYPLERIATPTLVISVQDDLFGTYDIARYTAAEIPGARFVGYPSGGHVWVGHHDELMREVTAFLK